MLRVISRLSSRRRRPIAAIDSACDTFYGGELRETDEHESKNGSRNNIDSSICKRQFSSLVTHRSLFLLHNHQHRHDIQRSSKPRQIQISHFHKTAKKEIIPLIAVGSLVAIGTYSYRALNRMDEEWDEYEEALKEYKLEHGLSDEEMENIRDDSADESHDVSKQGSFFRQGKMAIDLGSTNIRIAHYNPHGEKNASDSKPQVVVNREGSRSTPNSIIIDTDGSILSGKMASSKTYERQNTNNPVLNPYQLLYSENSAHSDQITLKYAVENSISLLAKDALEQVLGGGGEGGNADKVLFSTDSNSNHKNGYATQPIFTYPPSKTDNSKNDDSNLVQIYQNAIHDLISPLQIAKFIPEPLAALKGAKSQNVLPSSSSSSSGSIMVIDIGGQTTSISIVNDDTQTIQYHTRLDGFGAETIIESLMNYLSTSFYGTSTDNVNDTMGMQRLYDSSKSAIMEIGGSKHGRVQINIPYLSVDAKMQPKHLDMGISLKVIEAEFNDMLKSTIIPNSAKKQHVLSNTMNDPNDVTTLFSSMIMNVFEKSNCNPFTLDGVLVIGGGARSTLYQNAIKTAIGQLAGDQFVQEKVVIPKDAMVEEMVVRGAVLFED